MSNVDVPIAHDQELREADQAAFSLVEALTARIEDFRAQKGLAPEEMRILDWGCGRGRTVLWLRERGYAAYGAEVDARPIENGRPLARARGLDADRVLSVIDAQSRVPFEDGFFHLIISYQVFEHVRDLDAVAREMNRLLAPGGECFHVYGATWLVYEGHLLMPFVHWLPDNALRLWLIRFWVWLGIEAKLPAYEGLSPEQRAQKFYRFTVEETHYRSMRNICAPFRRLGLEAFPDTVHGPSVGRHWLTRRLVDLPLLGPLLNFVLSRFVSVHLVVRKPAAKRV